MFAIAVCRSVICREGLRPVGQIDVELPPKTRESHPYPRDPLQLDSLVVEEGLVREGGDVKSRRLTLGALFSVLTTKACKVLIKANL